MKKAHKDALILLTEAFNRSFDLGCYFSETTGESLKDLIEVYPFIYGHWLESAVGLEHSFTPYDFICETALRLLPKGHFAYPYIKPNSYKSFKRFRPNIKSFTKHTHPVISDLKVYLEAVNDNNGCAETELGEILFKSDASLKSGLSFYSAYYVEYLHNLATELGLVVCLPSVSLKIFKTAAGCFEFFEKPDVFEEIFSASVDICCKKLNCMFPIEAPPFSRELIIDCLKNTVDCDEIMSYILSDYEIDLEAMLEEGEVKEKLNMKSEKDMIISSTHFLATILSKWFYNVFAYYLHIIRPSTYYNPGLYISLQFYIENSSSFDYGQKAAVFLTLPEYSSPTPFGAEVMNIRTPENKYNEEYISKVPLKQLCETLFGDVVSKSEYPDFKEKPPKYFTLNIYNEDKPKEVKTFTFAEYETLDKLYFTILNNFRMRTIKDYSLFTDESRSPFSEYTNYMSNKPHKKVESTLLNEVFAKTGDKVWLRLNKNPGVRDKKPCYDYAAELIKTT